MFCMIDGQWNEGANEMSSDDPASVGERGDTGIYCDTYLVGALRYVYVGASTTLALVTMMPSCRMRVISRSKPGHRWN